jgi:hypothetical protein
MNDLVVTIPERPAFYSLYAQGTYSRKVFVKAQRASLITFPSGSAVCLYYTYPTHREACVIRNTGRGTESLPGLSKKVSVLFTVRASRVDKLRRALGFLKKFRASFPDDFYIRLYYIVLLRGKINYPALDHLVKSRSYV